MQVLWWKLIIYDLPMGKVSVSLTVSFGFVTYFWMRWSVRCGHKARHRRSIRGKKAYLYSQVLETRAQHVGPYEEAPRWAEGSGQEGREGLVQSFIGVPQAHC